jgi:AcrR family transcriptional regulator
LSIDDIVSEAVRIADREGFAALSMRRLAQALDVGTMTLYWYLDSRDDLTDLVLDAIAKEQLLDSAQFDDWREGLRAIARASKALFERHPWMIEAVGRRTGFGPNMMRHVEQSLTIVNNLDVDDQEKGRILNAVDDYAIGHATRALAMSERLRETGYSEQQWFDALRPYLETMFESGKFPLLEHFFHNDDVQFDDGDDENFEYGLDVVIAGIEAQLASKSTSKSAGTAE